MTAFAPERPWRLGRGVALRPERFGALAYSFDTRRLSFLKSPRLHEVVRTLAAHPSARAACEATGAQGTELVQLERALGALAASGMIEERTPVERIDPADGHTGAREQVS